MVPMMKLMLHTLFVLAMVALQEIIEIKKSNGAGVLEVVDETRQIAKLVPMENKVRARVLLFSN